MMNKLLTTLLVFRNAISEELIRSVHVYQVKNDKVDEVEREFMFSESGPYGEMEATRILTLEKKFCASEVSEGYQDGVWLCIFSFHRYRKPQFSGIPPLFLESRNPKLRMIQTLLEDLRVIYKSGKDKDIPSDSPKEECQENSTDHRPSRKVPVFQQDLNCLPYDDEMSESPENDPDEETVSGSVRKKRRAHSYEVARLMRPDLVKCFDMPITEASKKLNVGLTVLKKKCRQFGIPRWPYRKIKSLDGLIQNLQEEVQNQDSEDKAAAAMEKQRMLESEKENIERRPSMDIRCETKRLRQDIFKRRHRARALVKPDPTVSSDETTTSESQFSY